MHVTNYSINKHQPGFVANKDADCDGVGSKWSLRALQEHLEGHCGVQWQGIWSQVSLSHMPEAFALRACMMLCRKSLELCSQKPSAVDCRSVEHLQSLQVCLIQHHAL